MNQQPYIAPRAALFRKYFRNPWFLFQGLLGYVAYIWIYPPWFSAWLHRCRGVRIKNYKTVYIAANVVIETSFPERLSIGDHVYITRGARIVCHTAFTPLTQQMVGVDCIVDDVVIEEGAYIGVNAIILPRTRIGRCAVVGAGAVVTRDIPDFAIAVGVPARIIGDVRDWAARVQARNRR
jgi:acetyltransferase-like isoleucine patch superfamily enzyme